MGIIAVFIFAIMMFMSILFKDKYPKYQDTLGRVYELVTSYDFENYAKIEIKNDGTYLANGTPLKADAYAIFISGKFSKQLERILLEKKIEPEVFSLDTQTGEFSAEFFLLKSDNKTFSYITFEFQDETIMRFRVENAEKVFFGDNGLMNLNYDNYKIIKKEDTRILISELEDINKTLDKIQEITEKITAEYDSDYDKIKAINRYICNNYYYDLELEEYSIDENISLSHMLETKRSISGGFANLFAAMCESINIKTIVIKGSAINNSTIKYEDLAYKTLQHNWNACFIDNRWIVIDTSWNTKNIYENNEYIAKKSVYKYFDISELALSQTHRADTGERKYFYSS
jgi:transglutaminase-like putative cysteine protease